MPKKLTIEFANDFDGEVLVRINRTGIEVSAAADDPSGGGDPPAWDADFIAMFERFERYTKASPCRELAAALAAAGWTGSVPKPKSGDKLSQSYIRWERSRGIKAKPLVVYQHSKKLATLTGTAEADSFFRLYAEIGVEETMTALADFVKKMTAAEAD